MRTAPFVAVAVACLSLLSCTDDREAPFSPAGIRTEASAALSGSVAIDFEDLPAAPFVTPLPQYQFVDKGVILRNFHYGSDPSWFPTHSGITTGIAAQGLAEIALLRPARRVSAWVRATPYEATFQCLNTRGQSVGSVQIPVIGSNPQPTVYIFASISAENISRCFLFRIGQHEIDDITVAWEGCELFEGSVDEFPILNDPEVQAKLKELGQRTGWDKFISERKEQGVWVVRNALGERSFIEFEYELQNMCLTLTRKGQYERILAEGYTIEAQIHTHPTSGFNGANPGGCLRLGGNRRRAVLVENDDPTLRLEDGPSEYDMYLWRGAGKPAFPGFAFDPDHLHAWYWDPQERKMKQRKFDTDRQCVVNS